MFKKILTLLALASMSLHVNAQNEKLLISGEIEAKNSQVFSVPRSDNWRVQISWMAKEGSKVKAGDTVVMYDTASLLTDVEQLEAKVRQAIAQQEKNKLSQELAYKESQFQVQSAKLNVKKARVDAAIPRKNISELDHAKHQLALEKGLQVLFDAKNKLGAKKNELSNEEKRHIILVAEAKNDLLRKQTMLRGMMQKAQASGTVMYVDHPWTGSKIRAGDTVQKDFTVLTIPNTDDLHVKAWLNEVDINKVKLHQTVNLRIDALPNTLLQGKVSMISNQAEVRTSWGEAAYFVLGIKIDGEIDSKILPGMSVLAVVEGL
ncbi:MAG: HlyD family efflux transporter periplasmic adaptor subunit [Psychrobium sp.]|nr:HlyD family efflux transporter periplasmic adaptor subunit [Psychrobium sp.]